MNGIKRVAERKAELVCWRDARGNLTAVCGTNRREHFQPRDSSRRH
jgi:hypothetical protein